MFSRGMKRSDAELMQYRRPPASRGPSGNTCPRCELLSVERTSVLSRPWLRSRCSLTDCWSMGRVKLGQPQPESNLSLDENNGVPSTTSTYMPLRCSSQYSFLNGGSVGFSCRSRHLCLPSALLRIGVDLYGNILAGSCRDRIGGSLRRDRNFRACRFQLQNSGHSVDGKAVGLWPPRLLSRRRYNICLCGIGYRCRFLAGLST